MPYNKSNSKSKSTRLNRLLIDNEFKNKLPERIYIAASLIALTASIIGLLFNLIISLSLLFNLSIIFIAASYAIFYYFARFKNHYFKNIFVLISQLGLALSWYSEGGLSGPVLPLFVVAIVVFTAISDTKYHLIYLLLSIINIISLFLLEQSEFGNFITQYPNKISHDANITFTLVVAIVSIFLFAKFIKKSFQESHETVINQKKELQELNNTKDKFFSIISHDLRGPLSGMLGLTKLMADKSTGLSKEDLQDLSAKLAHSANSTYSLLENLLNWAKMNQGIILFKPQLIPLKAFASIHLEVMQNMANTKNINTANHIPDDLIIFADEYMLQTIIRNIILNAIKFTESNGKVSINAKAVNDQFIEVSIEDTGVGMSAETIENLFSIDKQIKRAGTNNEPSSGLGLLLCKEFIAQHHGEINVESQEGHGSIFKFTLPISASTLE